MHEPAIDIIIVSYNTRELLRKCLHSIQEHAASLQTTCIVVDNGSTDGSSEMLEEEFPRVTLIRAGGNIGFGPANNLGLQAGSAPYVLCLNSDAQLLPNALQRLLECLQQDSKRVIAGPRLQNPDGSFQASCRRFPNWSRNLWVYSGMTRRLPHTLRSLHTWLDEAEHQCAVEVDMVSGACFLARRDYLESIGGFDEGLFLYEEELDIMLPARRRGQFVVYCPTASVVHLGGASVEAGQLSQFASYHTFRSKYRVFRKHYGSARARAAYFTDVLLFSLSRWRHPGKDNTLLATAKAAWRDS